MNLLKQTRYTLVNKFHNTTVSFLAPYNHDGAYAAFLELDETEFSAHKDSDAYKTAHRKLLRIRRELCPHNGKSCKCSGMIRGAV